MLRSDLQLSADMILTQLPQKIIVFICQYIIKTDPRTDKNLLDAGNLTQFSQQLNVIRVVCHKVFAGFREQTLSVGTDTPCQLLFAGRMSEIRRWTAYIMDVSLKIRLVSEFFCLLDDRCMTPCLDSTSLMKSQRTEIASSETAPVADQ